MATKRIPNLPGTTDRRIDMLLTLLAENATIVISGAKIAKEIGVTRQQVWRWMEKLRALGVRVKGHPRTGYHIERVPDILLPQMLTRGLHGTAFVRRIHHFFKIDSTNAAAMRLGEAGELHGAVVLAEEQTAGRGRAGRSWSSEKSAGIYCSVLLRPRIPPAQAPLLTLVAGLADAMEAAGVSVFGPRSPGARLEGSKTWARDLCDRYGIAQPWSRSFTAVSEALDFVRSYEGPYVVKADGLAAGKGVTVTPDLAVAEDVEAPARRIVERRPVREREEVRARCVVERSGVVEGTAVE